MTSYLIALIDQHDPAKHWAATAYGPRFGELLRKYGGEVIAAADIEQVEGAPLAEPRAAVFQFPTIEAVRGFWNDPGYKEVVELRRPLGTFQIFMLPGKDEALSEGGRQGLETNQRHV
ncbi:MAG: hypothetical protein QOJ19_2637 [Acidimicrobiia bacterium]|nr:hypothetical protein [Acidimicrobiia bacterium]